MKSPPSSLLSLFTAPQIISSTVISGYHNQTKLYAITADRDLLTDNYIKIFSELISQDIFIINKLFKLKSNYIVTFPTQFSPLKEYVTETILSNQQTNIIIIQLLNLVNMTHCKKFIHGNINTNNLYYIQNKLYLGLCGPWSDNYFEIQINDISQKNDLISCGKVILELIANKQTLGVGEFQVAADMLIQGERCGKVLDFLERKGNNTTKQYNNDFIKHTRKKDFNDKISELKNLEKQISLEVEFPDIINIQQDEYCLKILQLKNQAKEVEIDYKTIIDGVNNKYNTILTQYDKLDRLFKETDELTYNNTNSKKKIIIQQNKSNNSQIDRKPTKKEFAIEIFKISANFNTQMEIDFAFSLQFDNFIFSGESGKQFVPKTDKKLINFKAQIDVFGEKSEGADEKFGIIIMCCKYQKVKEFYSFSVKIGSGEGRFWILSSCGKVSLYIQIDGWDN